MISVLPGLPGWADTDSLWRTNTPEHTLDKIDALAARPGGRSENRTAPLMFGAQAGSLNQLSPDQLRRAESGLVRIFEKAGLLAHGELSPQELASCVVAEMSRQFDL
mmetsp:Transcript_83100/g.214108  ORF Transcript_83100/g.214108 Transcript_83100/m.214108 type:complete len:107 (+) Transcript_83100:137-457(+)